MSQKSLIYKIVDGDDYIHINENACLYLELKLCLLPYFLTQSVYMPNAQYKYYLNKGYLSDDTHEKEVKNIL